MLSFRPITDRIHDYWPIVWLSSLLCKNHQMPLSLLLRTANNAVQSNIFHTVQRIQSFKVKEFQSLIWFAVHGFFTSSFYSNDHFSQTWRWFIMGPPFIWEWNWLCCNSVWYLFNFLDASIILKQQHFYRSAGFGLCLGWRDCFTLRLGFAWEEAQTERPLDTLNMSPLISKLPFSNTLYTASANRALTRGEVML